MYKVISSHPSSISQDFIQIYLKQRAGETQNFSTSLRNIEAEGYRIVTRHPYQTNNNQH